MMKESSKAPTKSNRARHGDYFQKSESDEQFTFGKTRADVRR